MTTRQILLVVLTSSLSLLAILFYADRQRIQSIPDNFNDPHGDYVSGQRGNDQAPQKRGQAEDFVIIANQALSATVHITTKISRATGNKNATPSEVMAGSGSGVIISPDGYIVTNNHVIDGAGEVMVSLNNKKSFYARVIGTDLVNDLAVLKIEARGLPSLLYGNSDQLKIGQWVLALGYPFNLKATVTAGIVSAKGGLLDLRNDYTQRLKMQSFIQTDAVINRGNSGGPLINTAGQLIGINSYLSSATGAYTGYSFSIPVNTVKKVVNEIIKHAKPYA
jgi:serine protease Do